MIDQNKTVKTMSGKVVSDKMNKTIAVLIVRLVKHPVYGKYIRRTRKILAHDEKNECREGDTVEISASRPLSRHKAWTFRRIVLRSDEA